MVSIPTLLFLALCLSMGSLPLFDPLLTFANQYPHNTLIPVAVYPFLFLLLPFTFFSAIVLLVSHVAMPQSSQPPLLRAYFYFSSRTKHVLIQLKTMASLHNLLFSRVLCLNQRSLTLRLPRILLRRKPQQLPHFFSHLPLVPSSIYILQLNYSLDSACCHVATLIAMYKICGNRSSLHGNMIGLVVSTVLCFICCLSSTCL